MTGDVQQVELGGGRRRWWPFVAAGVAVWVAVAVVAGGGEDPATAPSAPAPTEAPPSTTTTAPLPGAPLLGIETGWHLVVGGGGDLFVTDLDTGERTEHPGVEILTSRSDGIFTESLSGRVQWRPFPFDPATAVDLGPYGGGIWPVADDRVWFRTAPIGELRLVRLDGSTVSTFPGSSGASPLGVAAGQLVLSAGGDAFLLDGEGSIEHLSDGIPVGAFGDEVVLQVCDTQAQCGAFAIDVRGSGGQPRAVEAPDLLTTVDAPSPVIQGNLSLAVRNDPSSGRELVLIGADGLRPAVPEGTVGIDPWGASWSPDGRLIFVPTASEVLVIDPFGTAVGPDGRLVRPGELGRDAEPNPDPVLVATIPTRGSYQVAVVAEP